VPIRRPESLVEKKEAREYDSNRWGQGKVVRLVEAWRRSNYSGCARQVIKKKNKAGFVKDGPRSLARFCAEGARCRTVTRTGGRKERGTGDQKEEN